MSFVFENALLTNGESPHEEYGEGEEEKGQDYVNPEVILFFLVLKLSYLTKYRYSHFFKIVNNNVFISVKYVLTLWTKRFM